MIESECVHHTPDCNTWEACVIGAACGGLKVWTALQLNVAIQSELSPNSYRNWIHVKGARGFIWDHCVVLNGLYSTFSLLLLCSKILNHLYIFLVWGSDKTCFCHCGKTIRLFKLQPQFFGLSGENPHPHPVTHSYNSVMAHFSSLNLQIFRGLYAPPLLQ